MPAKADSVKPVTALVVIHLSSLDSYTELGSDVTGDYDHGWELSNRLADAIVNHQGPVFIVDQEWLFIGRESRPRAMLMDEIESRKDIQVIHFDEQETTPTWKSFLTGLEKQLRKKKVSKVILGGLFFEPDLSEGCVTHTYLELKKKGLKVQVDRNLVGCLSDFYPEGPPKNLPGGYTRGSSRT